MAFPPEIDQLLKEADQSMRKSVAYLEGELAKLRAGRVSPDLVEEIRVEYYGSVLPIKQIASVSVRDARTLVIRPWDKNALESIEKAILSADLGVNPSNDGEQVILAFPPLSEETRRTLVKKAHQLGEQARVAIRNIRREILDQLRKLKKEGFPEDLIHRAEQDLQKTTDRYIEEVEKHVNAKEKDILTI